MSTRHVEIATPSGPIVLLVPTSQRLVSQAIGGWLDHVVSPPDDGSTYAERRKYAERGDLLACAAVLQLATAGPCEVIAQWMAGAYADGPEAAPHDLLAWLEQAGVYLSDVTAALLQVQRNCNTPSEALVNEAQGNSNVPRTAP